jgi:hypothetical protein
MQKKLFLSIVAVLSAFFLFWGWCIAGALLTGKRIQNVFPHKILFLCVIMVMQAGIAASDPVRDQLRLWLRVISVAGGLVLASIFTWFECVRDQIVDRHFGLLWMFITIVFTFGTCIYLVLELKERISGHTL